MPDNPDPKAAAATAACRKSAEPAMEAQKARRARRRQILGTVSFFALLLLVVVIAAVAISYIGVKGYSYVKNHDSKEPVSLGLVDDQAVAKAQAEQEAVKATNAAAMASVTPSVVASNSPAPETTPADDEANIPAGFSFVSKGPQEKREKVDVNEYYPELHHPRIRGEGVKEVFLAIDRQGGTLAGEDHLIPSDLGKVGKWRWVEIQQTLASGEKVWHSTVVLDKASLNEEEVRKLSSHRSKYRPRG